MAGTNDSALSTQHSALRQVLGDSLVENEPLARHVSYRIGGPTDFFATITSEETMLATLRTCWDNAIPLLIIGNGSNVLISDLGWRGMVVVNRLADVTITEQPDSTALMKAGSGAMLSGVARKVAKEGWAGFEFAATIPGSVGGGVVSNAGAHGSDFSRVMTRVAVGLSNGERVIFSPEEMKLAYRNSRWRERVGMSKAASGQPGNELILWAEFQLQRGEPTAIKAHIDEMTDWRREKQPQEPNAGSVFKNPTQNSAGKLIEQAGLKGAIIGGAQISPKHANFIVNNGGAKASDVMSLIKLARQTIKEKYEVELELEIELLGEWPA